MGTTYDTKNDGETLVKIHTTTTKTEQTAPDGFQFTGEVRNVKNGEWFSASMPNGKTWAEQWSFDIESVNKHPILTPKVKGKKWTEYSTGSILRVATYNTPYSAYRLVVCGAFYSSRCLVAIRNGLGEPVFDHFLSDAWDDDLFEKIGEIDNLIVDVP